MPPSKPNLTIELIHKYLDAFISNLAQTEDGSVALEKLLDHLRKAEKTSELPPDIKDCLNLLAHRVPKNLVQVTRAYVESKVPILCSSSDILTQALQHVKQLLELEKRNELNYFSIKCGASKSNLDSENDEFIPHQEDAYTMQCRQDVQKQTEELAAKRQGYTRAVRNYAQHLLETKLRPHWKRQITREVAFFEGSPILLVRGAVIILSKVINDIEAFLAENIAQVHLVAEEIIYIDCNLNNEKWHGRNIFVMSKKIDCVPVVRELVWNVSGNSGMASYHEQADDGYNQENRDGEDGISGMAGESGGHVLLVAEEFGYTNFLGVKSHGEDGEDGQNGGNGLKGQDGRNGYGNDLLEFKQALSKSGNFPCFMPNMSRGGGDIINLTLLVSYLNSAARHIENSCHPGGLLKKADGSSSPQGLNLEKLSTVNSFFVEGITKTNQRFTLVFYKGFRNLEVLFIFKGSKGTEGTPGGEGGLGGAGGQAGYPGGVQALQINGAKGRAPIPIKCENQPGKPGNAGKDGDSAEDGVDGKNGPDFAYIYKGNQGKIFPGKNLELMILDKKSKGKDNVWSDKHNAYVTAREYESSTTSNENGKGNKGKETQKNQGNKEDVTCKLAIEKEAINQNVAINSYKEVIFKKDIEQALQKVDVEWWSNQLLSVKDVNNN